MAFSRSAQSNLPSEANGGDDQCEHPVKLHEKMAKKCMQDLYSLLSEHDDTQIMLKYGNGNRQEVSAMGRPTSIFKLKRKRS